MHQRQPQIHGAADPAHQVTVLTVKMEPQATWSLAPTEAVVNRSLYFYKGSSVKIEGQELNGHHLMHVNPHEEILLENGEEEGFFLILQGMPLNEPVAQYGPFVMNTQEEIHQAIADYRRTEFGGWPWPLQEQVHAREKGRFALHADGREELK